MATELVSQGLPASEVGPLATGVCTDSEVGALLRRALLESIGREELGEPRWTVDDVRVRGVRCDQSAGGGPKLIVHYELEGQNYRQGRAEFRLGLHSHGPVVRAR